MERPSWTQAITRRRDGTPRPIVMVVRHAPAASPLLAATVGVIILASALLPNAFILATGAVVSAVTRGFGRGLDSPAGDDLVTALVAVGVLFVLQQSLEPLRTVVTEAFALRFRARVSERVMQAILSPPGIAHLEDPATLDRISQAQGVGPGGMGPSEALRGVVMLAELRFAAVISAVILARFSWWLALLLLLFRLWIRKTVWREMARGSAVAIERTQQARFSNYLRDLTLRPEAAKETRLFGLGSWIVDRFVTSWTTTLEAVWRERRRGDRKVLLGALYVFGADLVAFVLIARAAASGDLSPAEVAVYVQTVLSIATIGQMRAEDQLIQYGAAALPAALDLDATLDRTPAAVARRGAAALPAGAPRDAVVYDAVSFAYPGSSRAVLRDLDLEITAGKSLAIVGSNGAGKTSLVKLLCALYEPTAGRITVDGTDLRTVDPAEWRRRLAAIFQDFARYELSARDNVAFGAWDHAEDADALHAAATKAGAAGIIDGLPHGWQTVLARQYENGTDLSGGQWQRVALARALFAVHGGAGVLILDEPTANLDVRAEVELFDRFLELTAGLTTILVSHRFSTVRRADRIVVLEDGSGRGVGHARRADSARRPIRHDVRASGGEVPRSGRIGMKRAGLFASLRVMVGIAFEAHAAGAIAQVVLQLLNAFGFVVQAYGLKLLVDAALAADTGRAITGALTLAGLSAVSRAANNLGFRYLATLQERADLLLDRRIMTLTAGVPTIEHHEHAEYANEIDLLRQERAALSQVLQAISGFMAVLFRAVFTLGLLASLHPALVVLPLFALPSLLTAARSTRLVVQNAEELAEPMRRLQHLFTVGTTSAPGKELRVFGLENELVRRYGDEWRHVVRRTARTGRRVAVLETLGWISFGIGFAGAIALVAVRAIEGDGTPGDVALAFTLAGQVNALADGAAGTVAYLVRTVRVAGRLVWLQDYARERATSIADPAPAPEALDRGIALENVGFTYPGTERMVLDDISVTLRAASVVAVVGENGAGKTTLVKLLCKMYEPSAGRITVDDVDLARIPHEDWRGSRIGRVPGLRQVRVRCPRKRRRRQPCRRRQRGCGARRARPRVGGRRRRASRLGARHAAGPFVHGRRGAVRRAMAEARTRPLDDARRPRVARARRAHCGARRRGRARVVRALRHRGAVAQPPRPEGSPSSCRTASRRCGWPT